jgi:hypothetical protein
MDKNGNVPFICATLKKLMKPPLENVVREEEISPTIHRSDTVEE